MSWGNAPIPPSSSAPGPPWAAPPVGTVIMYQLYRVAGSAVTPATILTKTLVATLPGTVTQFLDNVAHHDGDDGDDSDECKGGNTNGSYTYFVVATVSNPGAPGTTLRSGASNLTTVAAPACQEKRDR